MTHIVRGLLGVGAAVVAMPAAIGFAAPASADEEDFVRVLTTRFVYLTPEQVRAEGQWVCSVLASGVPASDAVMMVRNDLGMSVSGAGELVSLAVVELDC